MNTAPSSVTMTRKSVTLHRLQDMYQQGEKISMLTCYDATFTQVLEDAGVDCLLVGDSLGMVLQGQDSTLAVSMDHMVYHTQCVARARRSAWLIADMPFGSYQESIEQGVHNAVRLMAAGAHMVKVEGSGWTPALVHALTQRGIPVCAHLGLTPQSVHALGGYRIQGRDAQAEQHMLEAALDLQQAGAAMVVLELIPAALGATLTQALHIPTIGIGAGPYTSGQVLVLHDMLGLNKGRLPRFVRNFMQDQAHIEAAIAQYVRDVKAGVFPHPETHSYTV